MVTTQARRPHQSIGSSVSALGVNALRADGVRCKHGEACRLGIGICLYLIMFTSKKLDSIFDVDEHIMYYVAFGFLHVIMLTKYVLQEIIEDEPDWVVEDRENTEQRVKQVL